MKNFVLLVLGMCLTGGAILAQGVIDPRRMIIVQGEAQTYAAPDRASIVIGVETEGADVTIIKADNDKRVKALYSSMKGLGIAEKDIQTSDLQIRPQYDYSMGKRTLTKYVMHNVVYVTVRDLSKVDKIINAAVAGGANVLNSVDFSISTAKFLRDSLRIEAVKDAMVKANALASAAGSQMGHVLSIEEETGNAQPIPMFRANAMMAESKEEPGTEVSAGQLMIKVSVTVKVGLE